MAKQKPMPLIARLAMMASPRQAILTLKNRGRLIDVDGCALMAFAKIAELVATRNGYTITAEPVRNLLSQVDNNSVDEEAIDEAHDMIEAAGIMFGIVSGDEWQKAIRDIQIAVELDAIHD
jgi:hypothetical protein